MPKFRRKNGYWANPQNRQTEFERLGKELGFTKPEDWYRIKTSDFSKHDARGLLKLHRDHRTKVLQEFYPENINENISYG